MPKNNRELKITTTPRRRKTIDPCPDCFLHRERCICEAMPKLDLKTKITLVIHAKELKRTTNTGQLALKALVNHEMIVRGADREAVDLSDLLTPKYRTVLFYPSEDAVELNQAFVNESPLPLQIIVPDGSWRQASKVHYRHHELKDVVRIKITTPNLNPLHMRVETTEFGMATLEAIALALEIIEGEEVGRQLKDLYQKKLEATLRGRGIIIKHGQKSMN